LDVILSPPSLGFQCPHREEEAKDGEIEIINEVLSIYDSLGKII